MIWRRDSKTFRKFRAYIALSSVFVFQASPLNAASIDFFSNSYTYYGVQDMLLWDVPVSGWGSVDVTYDAGSQPQYFNLVVNGEWKIINMTLGAFNGIGQPASVTFNFGLDTLAGGSVDYGFAIGDTPLDPGDQPLGGLAGLVGARGIVGSLNEGDVPWILGVPPAALAGGAVADGGVHAKFPNQECPTNFCVPVSVSNSLQWLNSKYGLNMPADKITTDALAKALGTDKDGTPVGWWEAKEKYLKDNKLPVVQTVSEAIDDAIKALKDGKDIEMGAGGHRAALVGINKLDDGRYELSVAHDTEQGKAGGTKIEKGIYDPATKKISGITFMDGETLRNFVIEAAAPVPEPSTWLLMIAGFGALGWRLRTAARRTITFC